MNSLQSSHLCAAWSAMLAATTISGTVVIGCMMPFAAIATIAALALPRWIAFAAILVCWLGNQIIGFGLLGYPWDGPTFGAGLSLLWASLFGWGAAMAIVRWFGTGTAALAAFAGAFIAYEATLFVFAAVFGDVAMFAPEIVGLIAVNDGLWFAGLWFGWQVLRLAIPATDPQRVE